MTTQHVGALMTADPLAVEAKTTLTEVADLIARHHISGVPVVGPGGRLVGVVSATDLVDFIASAPASDGDVFELTTAEDVMTRRVLTVPPDTELATAARMMVDHAVHRLFVIQDDELLGVLTTKDLLRLWLSQPSAQPGIHPGTARGVTERREEIMTSKGSHA